MARRSAFRGVAGFLLLLPLALALACASDSGPPEWFEHPHRKFPQDRYATGVGRGPTRAAAAEAARADVARETGGETEGIEIARRWVAKSPRVHWALATLDRPALVERLGERIAQTERDLADAAQVVDAELAAASGDAASAARPPAEALERLMEAFARLDERESLRARIARLDGIPPPPDTTPSRGVLVERLAQLKRALPVAVEAYEMASKTGEPIEALDAVRRALARQVLAAGFALAPERTWGAPEAWLRVRAGVAFEPLDLGDQQGFTSVQWEASLEIEDPEATGRVVALLTDQARAVHLSARSTRRLAREQASEFLSRSLAEWLAERFTPQEPEASPDSP